MFSPGFVLMILDVTLGQRKRGSERKYQKHAGCELADGSEHVRQDRLKIPGRPAQIGGSAKSGQGAGRKLGLGAIHAVIDRHDEHFKGLFDQAKEADRLRQIMESWGSFQLSCFAACT